MEEVIVRCIPSYFRMVSEEVTFDESERYVSTLDGYYENDLIHNEKNIPLIRVEVFDLTFDKFCKRKIFKQKRPSYIFNITMTACDRKEANIGLFSYFNYDSESYRYYRIKDIDIEPVSNIDPLIKHISLLGNKIKAIHHKTNFKYQTLSNKFIKSKSFSLVSEPIGQGNLTTLYDDCSVSKICIDVGHGIPIGRDEVRRGDYKFDDKLNTVESVLLTHWDEDHYKLALDKKFDYLLDKFWYVPFCHDEISNFEPLKALRYEHRISVWETLLKIMDNNNFYLIDHEKNGVISLGANKKIKYFCGKKNYNSNDRGVTYNLIDDNKKSFKDILVCGDVNYSLLHEELAKKYTSIIVSHHGSGHLLLEKHPLPYNLSSKAIFSFGFNDSYKHPSKMAIKKAIDLKFNVHATSDINWLSLGLLREHKLAVYNKNAKRVSLK